MGSCALKKEYTVKTHTHHSDSEQSKPFPPPAMAKAMKAMKLIRQKAAMKRRAMKAAAVAPAMKLMRKKAAMKRCAMKAAASAPAMKVMRRKITMKRQAMKAAA